VRRLAIAVFVLACGRAWADDASADRAFRDAEARGSIDALEALGAERPATRWTDDAWSEAARLAERAGDFARARRDLEQAVATATDEALARRAKAELARLAAIAGASGEWAAVAAQHEQLVGRIAHGDPKPALRELEAIVDANPRYPRAALAMLAIGRGWERDGDAATARVWFERADRAATGAMRDQVGPEIARFLIRDGSLDDARRAIAEVHDRGVSDELEQSLARAEARRTLRWILWAILAAIVAAAVVTLRREAGSWRGVGRRLVRLPSEVWFYVPIALVLVGVAWTGNPIVARAVRAIAIIGTIVAWISGAMLAGVRPIAFRRAVLHAAVAAIAVLAATYLAIDRDRMIDLVVETWRSGPAAR
jgi:predicted negative regulator of RcsB-dependent stress response